MLTQHRSAAAGKVGALITAFAFGSVVDAIGLAGTLGLLSGVMFLCGLLSFLIPETNGKTLAEIEGDAMYGADKGREAGEAGPAAGMGHDQRSPSDSSVEGKVAGYVGMKLDV